LQLIESFKNECKTKGYTPTSDNLVASEHLAEKSFLHRKRRQTTLFLTKAGDVITNKTKEITHFASEDEASEDFELDPGGEFHTPVIIKNATLEAMCGTISLK
jgi:hypothetical protein